MPTARRSSTPRATTGRPAPEDGDPIEAFFRVCDERGEHDLLQRITGTLRFDVRDGRETDHWYVTVKAGDISVSHKNTKADAVTTLDRAVMEDVTTGRLNTMAGVLRGLVGVSGNFAMLIMFQRLFPGPSPAVARALIEAS